MSENIQTKNLLQSNFKNNTKNYKIIVAVPVIEILAKYIFEKLEQ